MIVNRIKKLFLSLIFFCYNFCLLFALYLLSWFPEFLITMFIPKAGVTKPSEVICDIKVLCFSTVAHRKRNLGSQLLVAVFQILSSREQQVQPLSTISCQMISLSIAIEGIDLNSKLSPTFSPLPPCPSFLFYNHVNLINSINSTQLWNPFYSHQS